MQKYVNVAVDTSGNVIPSTTVTVYTAGTTTPATIYSDNGVTAKSNPFLCAADGVLFFYAADGRYDVKLTKTGYTFNSDATYDVILSDPVELTLNGVNNFRLILSGGNLTLQPVNGNSIDIGGTIHTYTTMPTLGTAGAIIEGGALSTYTLYYIYVRDNAGTAVLEAGTTGYTEDSAGRPMRTGDSTRRCVGVAGTWATAQWFNDSTRRLVRSMDWRQTVSGVTYLAADATLTGPAGLTEIHSGMRTAVVLLSGDAVKIDLNVCMACSTASTKGFAAVGKATTEFGSPVFSYQGNAAAQFFSHYTAAPGTETTVFRVDSQATGASLLLYTGAVAAVAGNVIVSGTDGSVTFTTNTTLIAHTITGAR